MNQKYSMLLVFVALAALFAAYSLFETHGIVMPIEVFGGLLLIILAAYAYSWQKKWKEDLEKQMKKKKRGF